MKFNEAIKELQYRRGKRYVLTGDETYLKEVFIGTAKKLYPDSTLVFFPEDSEEMKRAFHSDLFEAERLIVVRHFEEVKTDLKDLLREYSGALILAVSEEVNIKTGSVTESFGFCTPVSCGKMSEYGPDYPAWLASKASENGYLFVEDAENNLYRRVGSDMLTLSFELEKLMIFKKETLYF